jgi:hypothetical protein
MHTLHTLCTPYRPQVCNGLGCAHTTTRPLKGVVCAQAVFVGSQQNTFTHTFAHIGCAHP